MGYKEEQFEDQKQEFLNEGFAEEDLSQCDRCYKVEPISELTNKHDSLYCEHCYDDCFVSWSDVFKRMREP